MHKSYRVQYFNCVTGDETVWSETAKKIGPVSKDEKLQEFCGTRERACAVANDAADTVDTIRVSQYASV